MKKYGKFLLTLAATAVLTIFASSYLLQVKEPEPSLDAAMLQQERGSIPPLPQSPTPTTGPDAERHPPAPEATFAPAAEVVPLQPLRTRISKVDWESARRHPPMEPGLLSESQQATVDGIDVPVLLPNRVQLLKSMILVPEKYWYAASIDQGEHSIFIEGSAKEAEPPGLGSDNLPLYGDYQRSAEQREGIMELDFTAFGIAYTVHVECSDWQHDPRCTEKTYILGIADDLVMAGGSGLQEELE